MVDSLEPDTIASTLEQTEQTPAEQEQTEKSITEDETNEECGELNNLGQAMEGEFLIYKDWFTESNLGVRFITSM